MLGALAVGLSVVGAPSVARAQSPTTVKAFMTLYGWEDNSPPGPVIAHGGCPNGGHSTAGGVGTFADPVTFATDVSELPWCTVIYVPYMQRYFIHEDECSQCDSDWTTTTCTGSTCGPGGRAGRASAREGALMRARARGQRADSVTDPGNPTVTIDPPSNLPVTTAPIFSGPTSCWAPVVVTNPGKQATALGDRGQPRCARRGLVARRDTHVPRHGPPHRPVDRRRLGRDLGSDRWRGKKHTTVTASDSLDSASVSFVWSVKRR